MKKLFFNCLAILFSQLLHAQAPDIQWQRNYGGDETENFTGLGESPDGSFYFAGTSQSPASGDRTQARRGQYDFWIVKTDANGTIIWNKAVGGGGATRMNSMTCTKDGGIILAGNSDGGVNFEKTEPNRGPLGSVDIWVIKLDANGNKVWDKTLGGTSDDGPFAVAETPDGGCIIAGQSASPISGDKTAPMFGDSRDCWAVKLDKNGKKQWDKVYGGTEGDVFYSVINTLDGGFLFGGSSNSGISGNKTEASRGSTDCWLVKTDANGNIQWDKTYGGDKTDGVYSIKQLESGEYIIGTYSESGISGDKTMITKGFGDLWLLKLNSSGIILWQKGIGGSSTEFIANIDLTKDGSIFIGLNSYSSVSGDKTTPSYGSSDYWVLKTNASGIILWQDSYGDVGVDDLYGAMVTSDGGCLIGGASNRWRRGDYWIIKLKGDIGTGIISEKVLSMKVFPNPSKDNLSIQLSEKQNIDSVIEIYDIEGKRILQEHISFENGKSQVSFDLNNGVYLMNVLLPDKIYSQKFVVSK